MSIVFNHKTYPVSWLVARQSNGDLDTNMSMQRAWVWNLELQSNLIITVLRGAPISNLLFEKRGGKFVVIDGKQRTLTLHSFAADGFALSDKIIYKNVDGVNMSGKKFSDLDEKHKRRIEDYQLTITVLDETTEDERDFVFYVGNQSKPLTRVEQLPSVLGESATWQIKNLCEHPFMKEKIKIKSLARNRGDDLKAIVQYLALSLRQSGGFSPKEMIGLCDDIRVGEVKVPYEQIHALFDKLYDAFPSGTTKHVQKISNVPYIIFTGQKVLSLCKEPCEFGKGVDEFFADFNDKFLAIGRSGEQVRTKADFMLSEVLKKCTEKN